MFCTQMPQEAQPVTLQGIEEDLSKALKASLRSIKTGR